MTDKLSNLDHSSIISWIEEHGAATEAERIRAYKRECELRQRLFQLEGNFEALRKKVVLLQCASQRFDN